MGNLPPTFATEAGGNRDVSHYTFQLPSGTLVEIAFHHDDNGEVIEVSSKALTDPDGVWIQLRADPTRDGNA